MTFETLRPLYTSGLVKIPNMVLLLLAVEDGQQISSLAGALGAPVTTVSMAVSSLVSGALVERRFPYQDQRQVVIRLTDEGSAAAESMLQALKILALRAV